jgi:HAD superfamily hydrolase (TIGR01509 family)
MIRNIIWDLDGTLFDTYPSIIAAFQAVLNANSFAAPPERIFSLTQVSLQHCADILSAEFGLDPEQTIEQFAARYRQVSPADQPPFPGVLQVCQAISALGGLNLVVTHRSLRTLKMLLEYHHLDQYISTCLSAQDGFPIKPDPAMFNELISRFGLDPLETLTVGDRDIDVQAGRAAGLRTCGFGAQISQSAPDLWVSDFHQLETLIKNENLNQ